MNSLAELSSFNIFRRLRRKLICSAATLLFATSGCQSGCHSSRTSDHSSSAIAWNVQDASPPLVPNDVDWAIQGSPRELQRVIELASQDVKPYALPLLLKRLIQLNLPTKSYPNSLHALGFSDSSTFTIFGDGNDTILAFRTNKPDALEKTVEHWNLRRSISMRTAEIHGKQIHLTWNQSPDSFYLFSQIDNNDESWVFVSLPPHININDPAQQRVAIEHFGEKLYEWSLLPGEKWSHRFKDITPEKVMYFKGLSAYGTVQPGKIIRNHTPLKTPTDESQIRAQQIRNQLLDDLGEFEFAITLDAEETQLAVTIQQSNSNKNQGDNLLPPLGIPSDEMPYFSTLAPNGTIGIVHIEFDPHTIFNFVSSLLPEQNRTDISGRLNEYLDKVGLDVQKDLIDNLSGHATAFIYGLANDTFQQLDNGSLTDILLLRQARKSILIPFKNTVQLVEFLDIATQLYPKNFVRKGNGHNNVEYIWHDGDIVKWGLLVKDKVLIYVDSYSAYENALNYDGTSVATLPSSLNANDSNILKAETRFHKLDHDTGIYLDLNALSHLLEDDSYYSTWAAWLKPYSYALLVSSSNNDKTVFEFNLQISKHNAHPLVDDKIKVIPLFAPAQNDNRPN